MAAATDLPVRLNIDAMFLGDRVTEGSGDREALRLGNGSLTYGEVDDLARSYGVALRSLGVQSEQRVILALRDGADFVAALFGVMRIGAVAVMVNPDLPVDQMRTMIERSRAAVTVVAAAVGPVVEEAAVGSTWPTSLLVVGGEMPGHPDMDHLDTRGDCPRFETHRDDPAIWLFSGGTTGVPKAVPQTHRSFANTTALYPAAVGYGPDDVTMAVPKLYFGYATGANLFFPFSLAATATLFEQKPTAQVLYDRIERHRPTILVHVPSAMNQMLSHPRAETADLSSLRFAISAGEALPESLHRSWVDQLGVEVFDGLGTAEMWHIFVSNTPGQVRPGTLGKVIPGFEVAVRDDDRSDLPAGAVGRLWVKGDSRGVGYWQDADASAATFRGEWVVTGDLVSRDSDGYVTHRGRADDAVKVRGKWFSPQDLEGCLLEHPAVAEAAAIPIEDDAGLLVPVAFVVADGTATESDLQQWVIERQDAYKHPRRVVFVEALPQTHLGKVDRGRLRALL